LLFVLDRPKLGLDFKEVFWGTRAIGSADPEIIETVFREKNVMTLSAKITPLSGWNSWNCYGLHVSQELVLRQAQALVEKGLHEFGYRYVIIDDGWQGDRGGPRGALQGNKKFSHLRELVNDIHALGLKVGIYSTPWEKSYGGFPGSQGHIEEDLQQWDDWGIDFIKYDWEMGGGGHPNQRFVHEIGEALSRIPRPMVLGLANSAEKSEAGFFSRHANMWRTTGDIVDTWESVYGIGVYQTEWHSICGPGRWNDADMLVLGHVGWGEQQSFTRLSAEEQKLHAGLWHFLPSPLLLGCDVTRLDDFTRNLLCNPRLIALHQDNWVRGAELLFRNHRFDVLKRRLHDGCAVAVINKELMENRFLLELWHFSDLTPSLEELGDSIFLEDVWNGEKLPVRESAWEFAVPGHGLRLFTMKISMVGQR
jgi:alpha-galactosidase